MATQDWYRQIHDRMLAGDPIASSELAHEVLDPLAAALKRKHPNLAATDLIDDSVTDALMNYIKAPMGYNPSQRGLFGYLLMSAQGDLLNALAKQKRRVSKEASIEDVEVGRIARNVRHRDNDQDTGHGFDSERLLKEIERLFPAPADRQVVQLILSGERATEVFVEVLGLQALNPADQKRQVKRHKDRIKKRLERFGGSLRAE
jgi:RNA polymerase sigma-70 factor (ECF subfamily)